MNAAKTNYLIEISEAEMVATIELITPLFMLLILVSVMTTISPQKIRPACGESVLNIILKKPITFMK